MCIIMDFSFFYIFINILFFTAYIQARDYNIIVVDWSTFSYQVYPISRYAINYVGKKIILFLITLYLLGK